MPYLEGALPFSGSTSISRHCSAQGAQDARRRVGKQTRRYLLLLDARGREGCTDWEAAILLGLERTTINARRVPLTQLDPAWVMASETRPGPTGIRNVVWVLTLEGQHAVKAIREAA